MHSLYRGIIHVYIANALGGKPIMHIIRKFPPGNSKSLQTNNILAFVSLLCISFHRIQIINIR